MTIQSDITTIQDTIDDIETAIINQGVTPSGGLTTFASAINNISVPAGIPREVSAQGVYQVPTTSFTFSLPSNATGVGTYALYYAFYNCSSLTSVDFLNLTTISGSHALYYAFYGCTGLTSVNLSGITTIGGEGTLHYVFSDCTGLTSVDLSNLTTIKGNGVLQNAFRNCTSLTTLSFPSLNSNSFGTLTNQFNNMLSGVTGCTVHFPSNLQSVIGSWASVTNGFGGTNTTVLFDLPATT